MYIIIPKCHLYLYCIFTLHINSRVYEKISFTRGGYKFSLIIVTYCHGILCYKIYFGSINEILFNDFIVEELSKYVNPYPESCSVIFLDNVPFHHNIIFPQIIDELGCIIIYLPRYEPRLNLSEIAIRDVKSIECSKHVYGEENSLVSLAESVEKIKNKPYIHVLKEIGYIKE